MISSRRLAREWALRILYQMDVGKTSLEEALETSLERLRREFVLRGSRTASGSRTEEVCLEWATAHLRDALPTLRPPMTRAVSLSFGHLLAEEGPYWQEQRLEKALRTALPRVTLSPAYLLNPLSDRQLLPFDGDPQKELTAALTKLNPMEREYLQQFLTTARAELPDLFDAEWRKAARLQARQIAAERPVSGSLAPYLQAQRERLNQEAQDDWRKVAPMVQKQISDWLQVASFTLHLTQGTWEQRAEMDQAISALASGWSLERQVAVDRNILRMAGFEMCHLPGVPFAASINEAVELAKKYSTAESGRFVNGVLGALAQRIASNGKLDLEAEAEEEAEEMLETEPLEDQVDMPDIIEIEE